MISGKKILLTEWKDTEINRLRKMVEDALYSMSFDDYEVQKQVAASIKHDLNSMIIDHPTASQSWDDLGQSPSETRLPR